MKKSRSRKSRTHGPRIPGMGVEIHRLAGKLMRQFRKRYPNADPYAFRDEVERMLRRALTLRIRGKRKGSLEVTKAVGMWRRQLGQIRRGEWKAVRWVYIAWKCTPDFSLMSDSERKRRMRCLQNSVYNRNHRAAKRAKEKARQRAAAPAGSKTE